MRLEVLHNLKCGYHSGFRCCDILWYSFILSPLINVTLKKGHTYDKKCWLFHYNKIMSTPGICYQRCPVCVISKAKTKVVKSCRCKHDI